MDSDRHLGWLPLPLGEGWGEGLPLETLHGYGTRRPCRPRLPISPGLAVLAAIGAIHQAALGLAALPRFTTDTRRAAGTASHVDLDQLGREIPWHGKAH